MQSESRISIGRWETMAIIINSVCTKTFLFYSRTLAEKAGTAGWILSIFISLIILVIFFILMRLINRFDGKDILDIAEITGGRPLKIITGMIISGQLFFITMSVTREFSEEMKTISLYKSPLTFVMLFFMVGAVLGTYLGIEAVARFHAIIVPIVMAGFILIILGVIPDMDTMNLYPLLGDGIKKILTSGLLGLYSYVEIIIVFLLPPYFTDYRGYMSSCFKGLIISSVILTAGSLTYTTASSYPLTLKQVLPIYQITRLINVGRFFQRIESMFVFIWGMAAFLYITTTFYFMVKSFSKAVGLRYMRPMILPFALILFSVAFIPHGLQEILENQKNIIDDLAWSSIIVFVIIVLIIASKKDKKSRKEPSK